MKLIQTITLTFALAFTAIAGSDHAKIGPTGGKVLQKIEPHVELLVNADQKIEIRFLNDENKVVAPKDQVVTITLGDRSAPTRLTFTRDGDKLVSSAVIPEGKMLPTVVQIKTDANAKGSTERFNLNLATCPTCKNAEYVCNCDHGHGNAKNDEHKH